MNEPFLLTLRFAAAEHKVSREAHHTGVWGQSPHQSGRGFGGGGAPISTVGGLGAEAPINTIGGLGAKAPINMVTHHILNTGHTRKSCYNKVSQVTELKSGLHDIPGKPGYQAEVSIEDATTIMVTVYGPNHRSVAAFGVAKDDAAADKLWPVMESHYYKVTDAPGLRGRNFDIARKPAVAPWVATTTMFATREEAAWLKNYEECIAWTWLYSVTRCHDAGN